jgi:hypothetical protein
MSIRVNQNSIDVQFFEGRFDFFYGSSSNTLVIALFHTREQDDNFFQPLFPFLALFSHRDFFFDGLVFYEV